MPQNVICPRCQTEFTLPEITDVPVLELADGGPPVLPVELVEEESTPDPEGGPFDPEVERAAGTDDPQRTPQQRLVAALLLRSMASCKLDILSLVAGIVTSVIMLPVMIGAGFVVVLVLYYPLAGLNSLFGGGRGGLLYLLPATLLLLVSGFRKLGQSEPIEAKRDSAGRLTGLQLGRLHDTFAGGPGTTLLMALLLLGLQAGLIWCAPVACDLSFEPTFGQAWLMALDSATFNNLLGVLEPAGVNVPQRAPTWWSDTVFQIFRLAYEAMAVLFAYQLYQRWKLRGILDGMPEPYAGAEEFVRWVDGVCRNEQAWPRRLFDEFLFLSVSALYLRGRWDEARELASRFPWVRVTPEVRKLFVDRNGNAVFPPA